MKWEILVLMAGDGKRFLNKGFTTPKPLIKTKEKTILEWTTSSLPFIKHDNKSLQELDYRITFAIRSKHNNNNKLSLFLKEKYGADVNIVTFENLTRGNLETAFQSIENFNQKSPLLILDADNKYNGKQLLKFIRDKTEKKFISLCCFKPEDDSEKWCFAQIKNNKVLALSEKKKIENGLPMVGVFYFSTVKLFSEIAKNIIHNDEKTRGEFYMSQSVIKLLNQGIPVYAHIVNEVDPLGTPEDLERFECENMHRPRWNHLRNQKKESVL